jgi:hypothetical protein
MRTAVTLPLTVVAVNSPPIPAVNKKNKSEEATVGLVDAWSKSQTAAQPAIPPD